MFNGGVVGGRVIYIVDTPGRNSVCFLAFARLVRCFFVVVVVVDGCCTVHLLPVFIDADFECDTYIRAADLKSKLSSTSYSSFSSLCLVYT